MQNTDNLAQIAQQYATGDEVNDPITGKVMLKANVGPDGEIAPRRGIDAGYDKLSRQFMKEHPSFSPDEIKHYETIFDTGKDPNNTDESQQPNEAGKGGQPAQQFQTPPQGAIDYLKAHPESRSGFEGHFGPADKYLK